MINWHWDAILSRLFATYKRTLRDHCGEHSRRTWMPTSSDNVLDEQLRTTRGINGSLPLSLLFLRNLLEKSSERSVRWPTTRKRLLNIARAIFLDNVGHFVFVHTLCACFWESHAWLRCIPSPCFLPPAPLASPSSARWRQRNSGSGRVRRSFQVMMKRNGRSNVAR